MSQPKSLDQLKQERQAIHKAMHELHKQRKGLTKSIKEHPDYHETPVPCAGYSCHKIINLDDPNMGLNESRWYIDNLLCMRCYMKKLDELGY